MERPWSGTPTSSGESCRTVTLLCLPTPQAPKDGVYETIALTNGSASGAVVALTKGDANLVVDGIDDATFMIGGELGDYPIDGTQGYTSDTLFIALSTSTTQTYMVDGVSKTQAQFGIGDHTGRQRHLQPHGWPGDVRSNQRNCRHELLGSRDPREPGLTASTNL